MKKELHSLSYLLKMYTKRLSLLLVVNKWRGIIRKGNLKSTNEILFKKLQDYIIIQISSFTFYTSIRDIHKSMDVIKLILYLLKDFHNFHYSWGVLIHVGTLLNYTESIFSSIKLVWSINFDSLWCCILGIFKISTRILVCLRISLLNSISESYTLILNGY